MVVPPVAPKISARLDVWDERTDAEVEVDRVLVMQADFTAATRLNTDTSKVEGGLLTGAVLDKLDCVDTEFTKLEAAAVRVYKGNLLRVSMSDCRLTGAEFAETHFEDCVFRNVKFDEAGFRFASFKRVRFENCMLRQADFSNAKLSHVTFTGCDLEATNFISASCTNVDVTTENLANVKGILGLKGATISAEQLIQLAPLLASELGFHVKD